MRILLAEDNEFNQDLAIRILSKHGHEVTLAENGQRAVEMHAADPNAFELILMDLRMPRLDGYKAAQAIREAEVGRGVRIPILAMSAHADRSDVESAREAGMDGHIAKPIDVGVMLDAIARATGTPSEPAAAERPPAPDVGWDKALALVGGDRELLVRVARVFLESEPRMIARVREAIAASDAHALEEAAHKLRGALGNFAVGAAYEVATQLEDLGAGGELAQAPEMLLRLETELRVVRGGIEARLASG